MSKQIFSTLAADTNYADWVTQAGVGTIKRIARGFTRVSADIGVSIAVIFIARTLRS